MASITIAPVCTNVFELGAHSVELMHVDCEGTLKSSPPKRLLIAFPKEEGEYPVLVLLHGYLLQNTFYSQLMQHVASHGFLVIAPQLYCVAGPDCTEEIKSTAEIINWIPTGLLHQLPKQIKPNTNTIALSGHSRGGKVAFAVAERHVHAKTSPKISALIGIDPVDGMDKGKQTNPPILTYVPQSFDLRTAVLVIGSGLGELKKNPLFPACAPKGVSHQQFFDECCPPVCHLVAKDYGHLDMLDDDTEGIMGRATYCLCKNGKKRKPMRVFVGGSMVAFMKEHLQGNAQDLEVIRNNPSVAPVEMSTIEFLD